MAIRTFHFELILDWPASLDEVEQLLATCSDASFGATDGKGYAAFHREADSLKHAIQSAVADVTGAAVPVVKVELSEPFLASLTP